MSGRWLGEGRRKMERRRRRSENRKGSRWTCSAGVEIKMRKFVDEGGR